MDIRCFFFLNKLIERKHDGFVKFIAGTRCSGKSHLLNIQFRKQREPCCIFVLEKI